MRIVHCLPMCPLKSRFRIGEYRQLFYPRAHPPLCISTAGEKITPADIWERRSPDRHRHSHPSPFSALPSSAFAIKLILR
jgi:hypothetical protein